MKYIRVLNIDILSIKQQDLLGKMKKGFLLTPNVDHLMKLQKDRYFYKLYQNADWVVCDSKVISILFKLLKLGDIEVITGSDLFPAFCNYHKDNKEIKIFLLGSSEGVAIEAMNRVNSKIGRNIIVGAHSPSFGFEKSTKEGNEIVERINRSDATVLVVGVGAPKQEKWIFDHKDRLSKIDLFMPLGATIDFEAGNIKRAPKFFQDFGVEWLYRLLKEPKRLWKRYLVDDMPFLYMVFKQRLGVYTNPIDK